MAVSGFQVSEPRVAFVLVNIGVCFVSFITRASLPTACRSMFAETSFCKYAAICQALQCCEMYGRLDLHASWFGQHLLLRLLTGDKGSLLQVLVEDQSWKCGLEGGEVQGHFSALLRCPWARNQTPTCWDCLSRASHTPLPCAFVLHTPVQQKQTLNVVTTPLCN